MERFTPGLQHLKKTVPVKPKLVAETPLIEVTTEEQLNNLVDDLYKCSEIAVDVEHHSYRSFMGITCLMQISTAEKDYLVDTLSLRDKLCVLNEIFTKPSIVKVRYIDGGGMITFPNDGGIKSYVSCQILQRNENIHYLTTMSLKSFKELS